LEHPPTLSVATDRNRSDHGATPTVNGGARAPQDAVAGGSSSPRRSPAHTGGMTQDISPPTRDRVRKKHTGEPGNGGQFGHTGREPSGLNLAPQDTAHLQRLFDRADRSAAQLARKMRGGQGWDHEDLAQDVKMEIVARAKRAGRVDPRDMTEAWVHYFTNGIIARVAEVTRQGRSPAEHYRARHESMAAYREFTSTVTERERALGRALSRAEKDAIAAE